MSVLFSCKKRETKMKVVKQIDIYLKSKRNVKVIDVVQYDKGIQLVFTVKDFTIPTGTTGTLYVQKPSGKFVYQETGITIADNTITINLENQAIAEHGKVPYQVTLENGSDDITTFEGLMMVQRSLKDSGATESKTVIRAFDNVVQDRLNEFQTRAEQATQALIATIPDDYTVMEAKVNELANAIKGHLKGAVVVADDVSPVEHVMDVNAHGKNLIDVTKIEVQTSDNIYISAVGEGYIEITTKTGCVSNGHRQTYIKLKNLCPQMKVNRNYVLSAETTSTLKMAHLRDIDYFIDFGKPVFITEAMLESYLAFYGLDTRNDTTGGVCRISNIQFEEGDTATDYEPYIDPTTAMVRRCGKNISKVNSLVSTGNVTGTISEVVHENATYTVSADVTKYADDNASNTRMTMLFYYTDGTSDAIHGEIDSTRAECDGKTRRKTVTGTPNPNKQLARIDVNTLGYSSQSSRNAKAEKIQLEIGSVATDYEPYNGTDHIPSSDGTVKGMTSLSPNMTILTDTEGMIVECEYNKDTNKVIQKICSALGISV